MSTTTTRLALYKPATTGEFINVATDINNNMDNIDAKMPAVVCTSGTRPGTPYPGEIIWETDTLKMYVWSVALAAWQQILAGTASFNTDITTAGGLVAAAASQITRASSTNPAFNAKVTGDAQQRYTMDAAGKMLWGTGAAVGDTNLYRNAVDQLKTDDQLAVGSHLTVGGNFSIGTATYRNRLSANVTVASTAAETVIATFTIPANDAVANAIYRISVCCLASVAAATSPTMTIRARCSGVGGTSIGSSGTMTASSGVTNKVIEAELQVSIITTGASGTLRGFLKTAQTLGVAGASPGVPFWTADGSGAVTVDTTQSRDLVITAQWGTSNVANTLTSYVVTCERVA